MAPGARGYRARMTATNASLTFVGNATTVLRLGGFTLLTDPNFVRRGQRVHLGYGLLSKRRHDPAFTPAVFDGEPLADGELPTRLRLASTHVEADGVLRLRYDVVR